MVRAKKKERLSGSDRDRGQAKFLTVAGGAIKIALTSYKNNHSWRGGVKYLHRKKKKKNLIHVPCILQNKPFFLDTANIAYIYIIKANHCYRTDWRII